MRLSLDSDDRLNLIRGYGGGCIRIKDRDIHRSVIVTPSHLITDWPPQCYSELREIHFGQIEQLQPEILLLGTGARQHFLHPRLMQRLLGRNIGVEVMNTAAACRTYNIVVAEDRRVAAALLIA